MTVVRVLPILLVVVAATCRPTTRAFFLRPPILSRRRLHRRSAGFVARENSDGDPRIQQKH